MQITLWIIAFALFLWYLWEKTHRYNIKGVLLKSAVSLLFVASGIWAALNTTHVPSFSFGIVMGLLFGLLGDIWLDLKYVYPDDVKKYTYAGFGMFAIGHIGFIAALLSTYADLSRPLFILLPAGLAVVTGVGYGMLEKPLKLDYGHLRNIVKGYGSILAAVMMFSGSLAYMNNFESTALNLIFAGSLSFIISDIILSQTYFGKNHAKPINLIANYIFYYAAQFMIAGSLWFD